MKQITFSLQSAIQMEDGIRRVQREMELGNFKTAIFHVFSGIEDENVIMAVVGRLSQVFPGDPIVGTLSAGEIVEDKIPEKGITASALLFEQTEIHVLRGEHVIGHEAGVGRELAELANAIPDLKAVELLLPGTEFTTRVLFEEMKNIRHGVAVYGGYSGGHQLEKSEHYIFNENGIDRDAVYAICYSGKDFHVQVDKSAGWQRLGMPLKVTKADENRLIEIDHAPAVEVYEKYLQISRNENFAEETFEFPLMAGLDGEELLRHTITVEEDGTLDLAGFVEEGMSIYLCYGNPEDIIRKVDKRLEQISAFRPEAIMLFSCSVRKSFWESFAEIELAPFAEIANSSGFYTWGEVKRNPETDKLYEYNITMLSVAMREGDPKPAEEQKIYRVDDTALQGQASLLKRLSKLVAATTGELQKAYMDLSIMNEKLAVMADYDGLTHMFNRRKIEECIEKHLSAAKKSGRPAGMIMLDIDHFKEVNDTYGHGIGDEVLSILGNLCIRLVKDRGGNLGRWGGEEFMLILPDTDVEEAYRFAEGLRTAVAETDFPCVGHLTISLGVCSADGQENYSDIYRRVDNALYEAKRGGRNCTVLGAE